MGGWRGEMCQESVMERQFRIYFRGKKSSLFEPLVRQVCVDRVSRVEFLRVLHPCLTFRERK